jgi:hypothetical protein
MPSSGGRPWLEPRHHDVTLLDADAGWPRSRRYCSTFRSLRTQVRPPSLPEQVYANEDRFEKTRRMGVSHRVRLIA